VLSLSFFLSATLDCLPFMQPVGSMSTMYGLEIDGKFLRLMGSHNFELHYLVC
jgi:hypothetical protein